MMLVVRRLRRGDDRSKFESGDIELDRFFRLYAGQNQFRHYIGVTYVALDDDRIVGFATVTPSQLEVRSLMPAARKGLPQYPLPVLRLARLAVDRRSRGTGAGAILLKSVLSLARGMAEDFGCIGLVVDAKPDAVSFYRRYGFMELDVAQGLLRSQPQPTAMFLELGAIPKP